MFHTLKVVNLSKEYFNKKAVDAVSLYLNSGDIVGLLGPNGAGKTTVFSMLIGLIVSDTGKILMDDIDISTMFMHQRAHHGIGYLPQEMSVFRRLSVTDNIRVGLEANPKFDQQGIDQKLEALLDEFHLQEVRDNIGLSLSGGERRRVEIARTLAREPLFVLLDEPFANVDPLSVLEIQKLMVQLRAKGIGLLLTDHNVRAALHICDRAYIMNHGKIIAEGNSESLSANDDVRRVYLGSEFKV